MSGGSHWLPGRMFVSLGLLLMFACALGSTLGEDGVIGLVAVLGVVLVIWAIARTLGGR